MKERTVRRFANAPTISMGSIFLEQALPLQGLDQIDPFLLIHHWKNVLPGGQKQQETGVGPHPHRGFSPVTLIFKGAIHHRDSRGNDSIVKKGGTQWMHAGMGIVHSERPPAELAESGGEFEIIQFWVNSPQSAKMNQPHYQPLSLEETPTVKSKDGLVSIGVVAGELQKVKGPIETVSPVAVFRLDFEAGGEVVIPVPKDFNVLLYQLDGDLEIDERSMGPQSLYWFREDGDSIRVKANAKSQAIILAGKPIGEKVSQYGPFVMNTQTELMEAMRDSQMGKMGVLIEEF